MSLSQVSLAKNDWLYINDEFPSQQQDALSYKMNGVHARRAERKFSPISKPQMKTVQGVGRSNQSVNPSSLWPKTQQGSVDNWMPRQPSKITSTKPDIDLLFSLFSVIDENENIDSEQDRSSPYSSPNLAHSYVTSSVPSINATYPVFPSQGAVNDSSLHYQADNMYTQEQSHFQHQQHQQQPYMASHTPVYASSDSFAASPSSYLTDEDYSASFDNEVVNNNSTSNINTSNYDVMTWLPPVFDNKLMEKAVPFSELVDVFCM